MIDNNSKKHQFIHDNSFFSFVTRFTVNSNIPPLISKVKSGLNSGKWFQIMSFEIFPSMFCQIQISSKTLNFKAMVTYNKHFHDKKFIENS